MNPSATFKSLSCEVPVRDHLEYSRLLKEWIMEEQSINKAFPGLVQAQKEVKDLNKPGFVLYSGLEDVGMDHCQRKPWEKKPGADP